MKTVAVIFGSRSAEHDVSIVTAIASIIKPLELTKQYNVEAVYIAKDGTWFWDDKLKDIKLYQTGEIDDFMRKAPHVQLSLDNGLTLVKSSSFAGRKMYKKIDIVFPATHGTHGEDGELMAICEMAGVAYVGCDPMSSAVAMDKIYTKQVCQADGIESTPWTWCTAKELAEKPKEVHERIKVLKYPLYVKPARLGSSIGITRVKDQSQLSNALEVAAHYDERIIIEQGVANLVEVTLPIIGNEELTLANLEQPMIKPDDFFDFEAKYMQGGKGGKKMGGAKTGGAKQGAQGYSKIPAELPDKLYKEAERVGQAVYHTLALSGISRVDMLIDTKAGKVFFNEVNPLPGSLYAHNWRTVGISNVQLVEKLIRLGEERFAAKTKLQTSFTTNFLKQF